MSATGLLLVFAEVGDHLSESEFHDWYDNEHVPLRTALPGFLSATRYAQVDGEKPSWAALYDLTSVDYLQEDEYAILAQTRSPREANVIKNIGLLDRRIYMVNEQASTTVSPDFAGHWEGMAADIFSMDVPPEHEGELNRWYNEEHTPMLSKIPGWLRTRRFILVESGATGTLKRSEEYKAPGKYLAIHEYTDTGPEVFSSEEFKAATSTPWCKRMFEINSNVERRSSNVTRPFEHKKTSITKYKEASS